MVIAGRTVGPGCGQFPETPFELSRFADMSSRNVIRKILSHSSIPGFRIIRSAGYSTDSGQTERRGGTFMLRSLSEQYALRAREFSDKVALLGQYDHIGREVLKLFKEIKRQRALCSEAEEKLERYLKQENNPKASDAA
jgi:hypothetical protein